MNLIKTKHTGSAKTKIDPQAKKLIARRITEITRRPLNPKVDQLYEAIERMEKSTNKSLFDHAVERAFKSDTVLISVLKKIIPDLKRTESSLSVSGGLNLSYMSDEEIKNELSKYEE